MDVECLLFVVLLKRLIVKEPMGILLPSAKPNLDAEIE